MAHEDYKEMLGAHSLNALDDPDTRALEEHLSVCSACRIELNQWEEIAASLSLSIEARPLEPSSKLQSRILEAVRAESPAEVESVKPRTSASKIVPLNQRRARIWTPARVLTAVAAGLGLVVLSASLLVLRQQNVNARQELARLSHELREAQQQIALQHRAIEIVSTPGTRMAELAGTSEMPGASAMLAVDKNGRAILMAKGLPRPPEGKAYQLWFILGDRPMPGKVFVTDDSGAGMLGDQVPAEALNAGVFAVTLEPAPGVAAPTGAMYLKTKS